MVYFHFLHIWPMSPWYCNWWYPIGTLAWNLELTSGMEFGIPIIIIIINGGNMPWQHSPMSITDIFPPWWDFITVGMCWVTMMTTMKIVMMTMKRSRKEPFSLGGVWDSSELSRNRQSSRLPSSRLAIWFTTEHHHHHHDADADDYDNNENEKGYIWSTLDNVSTKLMMQKTMTGLLLLQGGMGLWGLNKENGLWVDGASHCCENTKAPSLQCRYCTKIASPCFWAFFLSVSHWPFETLGLVLNAPYNHIELWTSTLLLIMTFWYLLGTLLSPCDLESHSSGS